jgi:hypothetical protein
MDEEEDKAVDALDSLREQITSQREQIAVLKRERDDWKRAFVANRRCPFCKGPCQSPETHHR